MIDAGKLVCDETEWSSKLLLAGLLSHDYVKLRRYADDGPPTGLPRRRYGRYTDAVEGWAELLPADTRGDVRIVVEAGPESVARAGIIGNRTAIAQGDIAAHSYRELGTDEAKARREADALAVQVAEAVHADLFITERPYLHETRNRYAHGVTVCKPNDALALIGLYLRVQGEYITYRAPSGGSTYRMNKGLYYWVGTRELLPAAWRWFAACVHHAHNGGSDSLIDLGGSLLGRTQTALEARDRLHIALNQWQDNDTAQEALNSLDVVLVSLMGAIDVAARVAHVALGLQSGIHLATWQRKKTWLKEIGKKSASLAAVVESGTAGRHTLTILRLLRNSVHGEALSSSAVQNMGGSIETWVRLPQANSEEILQAMDALGGRAAWGVEEPIPGSPHVDPGLLVEELFPRVVELLNTLMERTPVEQLDYVNLGPEDCTAPADPQSPFAEMTRESIRWQFGL